MSFYTALTGLNGSQADISATSNNIANVATTGYKRSKAEFGDIFATSPLQNKEHTIRFSLRFNFSFCFRSKGAACCSNGKNTEC